MENLIDNTSTVVPTAAACHHCGTECSEGEITSGNHNFCCTGCKTVYELLSENGLTDYYSIENAPGLRLINGAHLRDFRFLDNPEIAGGFFDFNNGELARVTFRIPAIHCSSCIWLLERLYKIHPAIVSSSVQFAAKKVSVAFRIKEFPLSELVKLLAIIGYEPVVAKDEVSKAEDEALRKQNRNLLFRIGVAGFCFGNIMLFSFPEYLGIHIENDPVLVWAFGLLNILLSIPVMLYSGREYLTSAWSGIRQGFLNIDVPIALGMLVLFTRSVFEILSTSGAGFLDSLAGLIFFLLVGKWFQSKTYGHLSFEKDYRTFFPLAVPVEKENGLEITPVAEIRPGDRIQIRNNEVIPCDGTLKSEEALIDYSFVTGEAAPVRVKAGEQVYAGGRQTRQSIVIDATKAFDHGYLTRLWNDLAFRKQEDYRWSALINKIAHYFTLIILTIAALAGAGWILFAGINEAILVITAVLIIACPCALALAAPFTYGTIGRFMARAGFYLKHPNLTEAIAFADTLVFDKTGTLTRSQELSVDWEGEPLSESIRGLIKAATGQSVHPLSQTIFKNLEQANSNQKIVDFEEISGKGIICKSDRDVLILGSKKLLMEQKVAFSEIADITKEENRKSTRVFVAWNGQFLGSFVFRHSYHPGIFDTLNRLAGKYELHLLSGDNDSDKAFLEQQTSGKIALHFNMDPHAKLAFIRQLQEQGKKVVMFGDGINDSGALKQANCGISVTHDLSQFSPSSDCIVTSNLFPQFEKLLNLSHSGLTILRLSLGLSFLYNVVGLSFAISGLLTPLVAAILMPLSSITIVVFATFSGFLAAKKENVV